MIRPKFVRGKTTERFDDLESPGMTLDEFFKLWARVGTEESPEAAREAIQACSSDIQNVLNFEIDYFESQGWNDWTPPKFGDNENEKF